MSLVIARMPGYTLVMSALLAIDTAGAVLSIALGVEEQTWYFEADAGLRHSELAMDIIDTLLQKAGAGPEALSGTLCMGGPGSFTGLRIGFSIAKGLGLALGIPFAPVPSLDCIALPCAAWPGLVIPAIDAKKNAFFCALFSGGVRLCADMDAEPGRIAGEINHANQERVLLTGSGAEMLGAVLAKTAPDLPVTVDRAAPRGYGRELLVIAKKHKILNNYNADWFSGPEYLRKSDAELHVKSSEKCRN